MSQEETGFLLAEGGLASLSPSAERARPSDIGEGMMHPS